MPFRYDVCNVKLQLRVKGLVLSQEAGGGGGGGVTSAKLVLFLIGILAKHIFKPLFIDGFLLTE